MAKSKKPVAQHKVSSPLTGKNPLASLELPPPKPRKKYRKKPMTREELIAALPENRCTASAKSRKRAIMVRMLSEQGVEIPPEMKYPEIKTIASQYGIDPADFPADQVRCNNYAIQGGSVCRFHGGSLPVTIQAAKMRLAGLVDPSITALQRIIQRSKHHPSVVAASKHILAINGLDKIEQINVNHQYTDMDLTKLSNEEIQQLMSLLGKMALPSPEPALALPARASTGRTITMRPEDAIEASETDEMTLNEMSLIGSKS